MAPVWRGCRSERGAASLPEIMIAMILMLAVVPIMGPLMVSSMRATTGIEHQNRVLDELRLHVQSIARELRSAECIHEPAHGVPGSVIRFTTNAQFVAGVALEEEIRYEILDGQLVRTAGGESRVIGEGLIEPEASFTQVSNPRLSVRIRLLLQFDGEDTPREIKTVLAGRNAWRTCS